MLEDEIIRLVKGLSNQNKLLEHIILDLQNRILSKTDELLEAKILIQDLQDELRDLYSERMDYNER